MVQVQALAKIKGEKINQMKQGRIAKHILLIQYNDSREILASLSEGSYRQGTPKGKRFCENANLDFWPLRGWAVVLVEEMVGRVHQRVQSCLENPAVLQSGCPAEPSQ